MRCDVFSQKWLCLVSPNGQSDRPMQPSSIGHKVVSLSLSSPSLIRLDGFRAIERLAIHVDVLLPVIVSSRRSIAAAAARTSSPLHCRETRSEFLLRIEPPPPRRCLNLAPLPCQHSIKPWKIRRVISSRPSISIGGSSIPLSRAQYSLVSCGGSKCECEGAMERGRAKRPSLKLLLPSFLPSRDRWRRRRRRQSVCRTRPPRQFRCQR